MITARSQHHHTAVTVMCNQWLASARRAVAGLATAWTPMKQFPSGAGMAMFATRLLANGFGTTMQFVWFPHPNGKRSG
jgi:hypothetical protein